MVYDVMKRQATMRMRMVGEDECHWSVVAMAKSMVRQMHDGCAVSARHSAVHPHASTIVSSVVSCYV